MLTSILIIFDVFGDWPQGEFWPCLRLNEKFPLQFETHPHCWFCRCGYGYQCANCDLGAPCLGK